MERPYGNRYTYRDTAIRLRLYRALAGLRYERFEVEPEDLESFIRGDAWEGVNVTIPYKRAVIPYLDELSDIAASSETSIPSRACQMGACAVTTPTTSGFRPWLTARASTFRAKRFSCWADRAEPGPRRCRCCATEVRARWPWGVAVWSPTTIWTPMLTRRSS